MMKYLSGNSKVRIWVEYFAASLTVTVLVEDSSNSVTQKIMEGENSGIRDTPRR